MRSSCPPMENVDMSNDKTITINARDNGPYLVSGLDNLVNSKGDQLATGDTVALCRCGLSANKPFCDGTHKQEGFSSANEADASANHCDDYVGKSITIHDNRSICAHAGKCTDGLPSVWRMRQEPWIDPDGADVAEIIRIIEQCPSGALSYTVHDNAGEQGTNDTGISIAKDGPYCVSDPAEFDGAQWAEGANQQRFTLCRCGASKNKPFCDGSHWNAGFSDDQN